MTMRLAIVAVCLCVAMPARASVITYALEGDEIGASFQVDTDSPDLCGDAAQGLYALPWASTTFGGVTSEGAGYVEVNNPDGNCTGGLTHTGVTVRLFTDVALTLIGIGHPGEALTLPLLAEGGVQGYVELGGAPLSWVQFDDVRMNSGGDSEIPEPATLLLFGSGLVWLGRRRCL